MNALILDGSLADRPVTAPIRTHLRELFNQLGWQVQTILLHEQKIAYCLGCFECWTKTPGLCRIDDAGRTVAEAIIQSDLVIFLTPITFGGYSSELKKAVDRSICLLSPFFTKIDGEIHHRTRYRHYPMLLGIGLLPYVDATQAALFAKVIERNAINYHAPVHAALVFEEREDPVAIYEQLRALVRQKFVEPLSAEPTGVSA